MNAEDKKKAIEIIAASNSPKVSLNVPVKNTYSIVHNILIHDWNAALINNLIEAGYSLSMCEKGLSVDKY